MSLQDYNVNVLVSFHHARDTDANLASAATICSTVELIRLFQLQVHQFCSGHTPCISPSGSSAPALAAPPLHCASKDVLQPAPALLVLAVCFDPASAAYDPASYY